MDQARLKPRVLCGQCHSFNFEEKSLYQRWWWRAPSTPFILPDNTGAATVESKGFEIVHIASMDLGDTKVQRMIADFMKASSPLEAYLQEGGSLSPLQLECIANTISGLQTFLDGWKRKNTVG